MGAKRRNILPLALTALVLAATAWVDCASGGPTTQRKAPPGSIAAQANLQLRLMREASGTLTATLNNLKEWNNLSPDQREKFRKEAYAFLLKNPTDQEKLIQQYAKFISMSAEKQEAYRRRAEWLKVVVASFTPQQRKAMEQMTPNDRAEKLLQRRNELVRQGKLTLNEPTTQPASPK